MTSMRLWPMTVSSHRGPLHSGVRFPWCRRLPLRVNGDAIGVEREAVHERPHRLRTSDPGPTRCAWMDEARVPIEPRGARRAARQCSHGEATRARDGACCSQRSRERDRDRCRARAAVHRRPRAAQAGRRTAADLGRLAALGAPAFPSRTRPGALFNSNSSPWPDASFKA